MTTEQARADGNPRTRGWILYDAGCPLCVAGMRCLGELFARRGFVWEPLQTPRAMTLLGVTSAETLTEMKLVLRGGRVVGGSEAWSELFRSVWWLWPVGWLMQLPGLKGLSCELYRRLARNRHRLGAACGISLRPARPRRPIPFFELP